jgi:hypothetical protein
MAGDLVLIRRLLYGDWGWIGGTIWRRFRDHQPGKALNGMMIES